MKFLNNRFAILPTLCTECQKYIFLETYKKVKRYSIFRGEYKSVICKECASKIESERR